MLTAGTYCVEWSDQQVEERAFIIINGDDMARIFVVDLLDLAS